MKKKHKPMRICVGCEELKDKENLLRVVLTPEGEMDLDRSGKKAGRGAYVCPTEECFDRAYKAKRLERSLKHGVDPDVYEELRKELHHD